MDVLAGVQYEFKEVLEKNMQLFFYPPRTGSYEIICNSNRQLQVKICDEKSEDFLLCNINDYGYEYKHARTLLYRNRYYIKINTKNDGNVEKKTYIFFKINLILEPSNTMFKYQWGLLNKESGLDINILPLWNYIKKTNVGIGIADTGINYNHCCLKNYVNPYLAYDFVVNRKEDSKGYCEYDDHGTSVAGIIAAIPLNDYGICGITENSCITSLKIFGENNSSKIKSSDAFVKAVKYSLKHNIKIINCRFSGKSFSIEEKKVMEWANDILFVIAAGNNACNIEYNRIYPACYELENGIVVAAVDKKGKLYPTSNYGNMVDVVAPGENVVGLYGDSGFIKANGTSVATPFVTGVCSLLMQSKPDAKPKDIKKVITDKSNVTSIKGMDKLTKSGGMINAYKAYQALIKN